MTSSQWFSQQMNHMLSNAENALSGERATRGERYHPAGADSLSYGAAGYRSGSENVPIPLARKQSLSPQAEYRYSSSGAPTSGPMTAWSEPGPLSLAMQHQANGLSAQSHNEMARQLRVCMNEIRELRQELAIERDARSSVMTSLAKRIKEEVLGDVHSVEHHQQRALRELEASLSQRITEQDNARALMKRTVDDALRHVKVQDRSQFDITEQIREQFEDMRHRLDSAVQTTQQVRAEMSQRFEKESAAHSHRLDVELMRYAEMHRQQQQTLTETRKSVAEEVATLSKTIGKMVEDCWTRRIDVVTKTVNESLTVFKSTQDRQSQMGGELQLKMAQFAKDIRHEVNMSTSDLRDRVVALEGQLPVIVSRVDRFERKADAVFETSNRLVAQIENLQELADKASVQAQKSIERAQKVEDSSVDRDERILKCESQLTALSGLERLKIDVEGLRRGLIRIEGQMDAVKQVADRDERLVETMQRSIDASLERADSVEKKAHRVVARVETAEQRLIGFVDRIIALEDNNEKFSTVMEQTSSGMESMHQRMTAAENRQRGTQEKLDASAKELSDRIVVAELRADGAHEAAQRSDLFVTAHKKEFDRLDKRLAKVEASALNYSDNVRETRDVMESLAKDQQGLAKKVEQWKELIDRKGGVMDAKLSEVDSWATSVSEKLSRGDKRTQTMIDSLEKRLDEKIEGTVKRMDDMQAASARRATQDLMNQGANGGIGGGLRATQPVADDTLALEVGAARRRIDAIEQRLRTIETRTAVMDEDFASRAEVQSVRGNLNSHDQSLQQIRMQVTSLQQQVLATMSQPPLMLNTSNFQQQGAQQPRVQTNNNISSYDVISPLSVAPSPIVAAAVGEKRLAVATDSVSSMAPVEKKGPAVTPTKSQSVPRSTMQPISPPPDTRVEEWDDEGGAAAVDAPSPTNTATTVVSSAAPLPTAASHSQRAQSSSGDDTAPPIRTTAMGAASDRLSTVSSLHGGVLPSKPAANDFDDDDEEEGSSEGGEDTDVRNTVSSTTAPTTGPAPAAVQGRPPLASGKEPPELTHVAPVVGAIPSKHWEGKKRTPYSDTSESEREQSQWSRQATSSTAATTAVAPPVAAPPVAQSQPKPSTTNFDSSDEEDAVEELEDFNIAEDTLRGSATFTLETSMAPPSPDHTNNTTAATTTKQAPAISQQPAPAAKKAVPAAAGGDTTDDDIGGIGFLGSLRPSQRKGFVSGGDTSSAPEMQSSTRAGSMNGPSQTAATNQAPSQAGASNVAGEQNKRFHATVSKKQSSAALKSFDDDYDDSDEDEEKDERRSQRSKRSAQSRKTNEVSLSLNSSKKTGRTSRRDEETIEDIEDDDQLAEMLGFMDAKKKK